jgi:biotin transport system substrate-specific component
MGIILGPTGGFIISFPLFALLIGLGADRGRNETIAGLIAGQIVNYAVGMICFTLSTGKGLDVAFTACVLPFIPTAIMKAAAAGVVGLKIRARVMSAA